MQTLQVHVNLRNRFGTAFGLLQVGNCAPGLAPIILHDLMQT